MRFIVGMIFLLSSLFALSLDEAIELLTKNNLDIQIASYNKAISNLTKEQQKQKRFGAFFANASLTRYNEERTLAPLVPPITGDIASSDTLSSFGISYNVTLFDGFATQNSIDMATFSASLQEIKAQMTLHEQIYLAQLVYSDLLSLNATLKALKSYLAALQDIYTITQKEHELGSKAQIDLLKINSQIKEYEAQIIQIQTEQSTLTSKLSLLVYGQTQPIEKVEDFTHNSHENQIELENIATIKLAKLSHQNTQKKLSIAKAKNYPTLELQASYSDIYGDSTSETIALASLQLRWNIFDFGVISDEIQKATIESMRSNLELEKIKQELQSKIIQANATIEQNKALLQSTEASFLLAAKTTQIEKATFDEGRSSVNDFLLAFSKELASKANHISSQYNLYKSYFHLEYLTKE